MTRSIRFLLPLLLVFASLTALAQQAPLPGQLLLRLAKDADATRIEEQVTGALPAGVHVKEFVPLGEGSHYRKLVVDDAGVPIELLRERMATVAGVEATSPNLPVRYRVAPNDPQYSAQWHMQSINVEPVWNVTTGGAMANGKRIAVGINDTGVQQNHPDLQANLAVAGMAAGDHGTEVAGVVGAVGNNGLGVTGVNWDVDLLSFANTEDLADAFTQFQNCLSARSAFNQSNGTNGHLVVAITVSWGSVGADCGFGEPLFDELGSVGILIITAGANDPIDIDVIDDYPATCAHDNNIVVTSIGPLGEVPYAVGNNTVQLLAPGLDIVTTTTGGDFVTANGNSFAIPHVAGAVALLYSLPCEGFAHLVMNDPVAARDAVKNALLGNTTPVPGGFGVCITGGKLNVHEAFQALSAQCGSFTCDTLTVQMATSAAGDEQYILTDFSGAAIEQGTGASFGFCPLDGCYTVNVTDGNGEPLDGTFTVTDTADAVVASGSIVDGVLTFLHGSTVPGCTDPAALNYDPDANCNDGSCCAGGVIVVNFLTDAQGLSGTVDVTVTLAGNTIHQGPLPVTDLAGTGVSGAQIAFCEAPGCLSITVGASDVPLAASSIIYFLEDQNSFQDVYFTTQEGYLGPVGDLVETCDGVDNDCDGTADEDFFWYPDADGDGWGANVTELVSCTLVPGLVQSTGDCDDADALINPGMPDGCDGADGIDNNCNGQPEDDASTWFADLDGDGWGDEGSIVMACSQQPGTSPDPGDCDDGDSTVFPGAEELCDGLDNDCDGPVDEEFVWYTDADGDGLGDAATALVSCTPVPGGVQVAGDCDDTDPTLLGGLTLAILTENPEEGGTAHYVITQGATVLAGDLDLPLEAQGVGQLDVCLADGCVNITVTPNDVAIFPESYVRLMPGDGFTPFSTVDGFFGSVGTPDAEVCDNLDNDCDGTVDEDFLWYVDADGDGSGDDATVQLSCTPIPDRVQVGGDCDDADPNLTTIGASCDDGDTGTINDIVRPDCTCLGFVQGNCPPGEIEDCNGNCAPAEWVGDGFCDDGSFEWNGNFIVFACPAFANDGGDCGQPCTTEVCDGVDNDCDGLVDESGGTQWFIDTDGDGLGDPLTSLVSCTQPAGYVANPDDNCPALAGVQGDACDDGDPLTQDDVIDATCTCAGTSTVHVALKAWLEGPYDATTGRMRDDLRGAGSVPSAQPYTSAPFNHAGGETVDPAVLTVADANDAIVDWVLVELRDAIAPATILHQRAALIQRDGDVVDTDGGSPVSFAAPGGSYHVALRHRNHFGVMTATAITLGGAPVNIDLTQPTTPVFGSNARKALTGMFPAQAMWAGNTNPDGSLQYIGAGNDRDPILINVGSTTPNNVVGNTYSLRDVNMDGSVRYVGAANDRDPILINVGSTTPNNVRTEQLP